MKKAVVQDLFNENSKHSVGMSKSTIAAISNYLMHRWRLNITILDIFKLTFKKVFCFLCSDNKNGKKIGSIQKQKMELYKKGEHQIL
jgi:hypothetical protein